MQILVFKNFLITQARNTYFFALQDVKKYVFLASFVKDIVHKWETSIVTNVFITLVIGLCYKPHIRQI